MANKVNRRQTVYGMVGNPVPFLFPDPVEETRAPATTDEGVVGQMWVNKTAQTAYVCTNTDAGVYTWTTSPSGGITAASFTISPGDLVVDTGDATIAGTLDVTGVTTLGVLAAGATTITGAMGITGAVTIGGNLAVTGDCTVIGDFDITNAAATAITSTYNGGNAIALLTDGGAAETLTIRSAQGTGAAAVAITSTAGGVSIRGGLNSISAISLTSTHADGGMIFTTGTAGYEILAANGPIYMSSGTATISIGADAVADSIIIGTGNAVKTISIGGIGANVIALANTQTAGSLAVGTAMTTGTVSVGGTGLHVGNFDLAPGTGAQAVSIANSTGVKTINIGNGVTGNAITIGNGVITGTQTVTIAGGASAAISNVNIQSGNATAGAQNLNLATGTSTAGRVVHIADGASANAVTIGSTNTTSTTTINAASGGIVMVSGGIATLASVSVAATAGPSATVTVINNVNVGRITFAGYTQAAAGAGDSLVLTLTNSKISATSHILASVTNLGANDAQMRITRIVPGTGTADITIRNAGAAALNGNMQLNFWVLS